MPLKQIPNLTTRWNSNIDCDIYRIFNAFLLNLTATQKSPQNSHSPMGIHHRSHTHPISIPMGIPIPTAALIIVLSRCWLGPTPRCQKCGLEGFECRRHSRLRHSRMEARKAPTGVRSGEGMCPFPRKKIVFSPLKWCILMHSGGRLDHHCSCY